MVTRPELGALLYPAEPDQVPIKPPPTGRIEEWEMGAEKVKNMQKIIKLGSLNVHVIKKGEFFGGF